MENKYLNILSAVIGGQTHQDYKTVTEKAEFYRSVVTGTHQSEYILSYAPREKPEQKRQRLAIYHERTKDTTGKIRAQFEKVGAVEHTLTVENNNDALTTALSEFDGTTLQKWVEERNLFYNFIDPNAWVLIYRNELQESYPVVASSAEAVDFQYKHGILKYLVICKEIAAKNKNVKEFTLLAPGIQITAREQAEGVESLGDGAIRKKMHDKTYEYAIYETGTNIVPANRFGYIPDYDTDMRTYAGVLDCATSLYRKLMNVVSEADLTNALHVFLQKFQVAEPCNYRTKTDRCRSGVMQVSDETCPNCDGAGVITHTTVQDVILVKPADEDGEQKYIPLSERIHYPELPFDIVKHQDEKVQQYPRDISMCIFGIDVTSRPNGSVTATEIENYYDSLNQVLYPFAQNVSKMYEFIALQIANNLDVQNVQVSHKYNSDFELMGLSDWLKIRSEANTAKASPVVLSLIDAEILKKLTNNNTVQQTKQAVLEAVKPFSGIPDTIIATLINTLPNDDINRYLYLYADKLLAEVLSKNSDLIQQPRSLIREIKALATKQATTNTVSLRNNL